jgi:hypothetical protein
MKSLDTKEMRKHFLIDRLFEKDKVNLVYSHIDRIITHVHNKTEGGFHDEKGVFRTDAGVGGRVFSSGLRSAKRVC